jgi:hypothetical protein
VRSVEVKELDADTGKPVQAYEKCYTPCKKRTVEQFIRSGQRNYTKAKIDNQYISSVCPEHLSQKRLQCVEMLFPLQYSRNEQAAHA